MLSQDLQTRLKSLYLVKVFASSLETFQEGTYWSQVVMPCLIVIIYGHWVKRSRHKYPRKSPQLAASSQTLKTITLGCHVITWSGPNSEKSSVEILQKSRPKSFEKVDIIPANDISYEKYSENFFSSKNVFKLW
jgi:hypothetical protein